MSFSTVTWLSQSVLLLKLTLAGLLRQFGWEECEGGTQVELARLTQWELPCRTHPPTPKRNRVKVYLQLFPAHGD